MSITHGHHIHDIHVGDRARAHFGDFHLAGGLTINAKAAPLTDYAGFYANNALAPVPTYVDRPLHRHKLEEQFHKSITPSHPKTQIGVVHGLGGVGKTQLVLDYIQRHRQDYSAIFWIEAANLKTIERDFVQVYILLYNIHTEIGQQPIQLQHAVPAVKRWFYGRNKKFLFVFDNADAISDPKDSAYVDLRYFLPDDPYLHVIVTSRDRSAADMTDLQAVEIGEMLPEEAIVVFQRQARIMPTTSRQELHIQAIVKELGYLALAITLAASYVAATPRLRADLSCYLPEYQNRRKVLLAQRPSWLVHQYGESVLTTWESTYDTIERQSPGACAFLPLLSFFNQDDIPAEFPIKSVNGELHLWVTHWFPETQINEYDVEDFFRILSSFSLIKFQENQASYSMHSLVQAWAYDRLDSHQQESYGYAQVSLLVTMTDAAWQAGPSARARIIPHIVTTCHKIFHCFEDASIDHEPLLDLLLNLAYFLEDCGHFKDEAAIQTFVLSKYQLWHGENDPKALKSMNALAMSLRESGHPEQALSIQRLLVAKMKNDDEDSPNYLMYVDNLAVTLQSIGNSQEALSLQRRVMEKLRTTLGEDHSTTLAAMNNIAVTLKSSGQLQEALSIQRTILAKQQQARSEDLKFAAVCMNNLGLTLRTMGNLEEALLMQKASFSKIQQHSGEDHPNTLTAMKNLARMLEENGHLQEALSMQQTVVAKEKQVYGDENSKTLTSMGDLAITLYDMKKYEEALSVREELYEKYERIQGKNHSKTLASMQDLRVTLISMGQLQDALTIQQEMVRRLGEVYGSRHSTTLDAMDDVQRI